MKKNIILFTLVSSILMFSSCTSYIEENTDEVYLKLRDLKPVTLSLCKNSADLCYTVSKETLEEYLKITKKLQDTTSIVPLTTNGDTLAYFAQYKNGWDVISADTRIEPVLATSDIPVDIVLDKALLNDKFKGVLDYIQSVKDTKATSSTRLWSYLQLRVLSKSETNTQSTKSARGIVPGMWREVSEEPQYSEEYNIIPHIITAQWNQTDPWNKSMPKYNDNTNYFVGCGPVAVGQVIHHFRKNNSRNIAIPQIATTSTNMDEYPAFSNFSSTHWNSLALNAYSNETNKNYTHLFLAYLAQQMDVTLEPDGTGVTIDDMKHALNLYQLDYNHSSTYNYYDIFANLSFGKPVIVGSDIIYSIDQSVSQHYYIIDRYKELVFSLTTTYEWIPDYQPTEWELQTLPQWRFELGFPDGREVTEETISRSEYVYFGMNWGWKAEYAIDDFYLVRAYTAGGEDGAGIYPGNEIVYTPLWTVRTIYSMNNQDISNEARNVHSVFYNIKEKH